MKPPLRRFLSTFSLITRLPIRYSFEPDFSRADFWLPVLGMPAALCALIGLAIFGFLFRDRYLAAIGALFVEYFWFDVFHLDGLLDTADALTGQSSVDRRLEILKDSRIGSYAFFFGFFALAASVAALAAILRLPPVAALAALAAAPVSGRSASALVPLLERPARPTGLGSLMRDFSARRLALGWALGSLPLAVGAALGGSPALWAAAAGSSLFGAAGGGLLVARLYGRKIGGFTGDALGAAVVTGELFCLLALAALLPRLFGAG
jgi:adenosylcobinamide-GDP ribazoletransferase